jgi:iron-sulfur cluster assembly accessory protein
MVVMTTSGLRLSQMAAERINAVVDRPSGGGLRVAVDGGGCSGFQYRFMIENSQNDDDLVFERSGAKVFVDSVSITFLEGSELDFVDDLIGQSFRVINPQVKSSCGCGTSFSI